MPILAARSSASEWRLVRSMSECTRSDSATLVPKRSAWISIATSMLTSSTPVRADRLRSALSRGRPARSSSVSSSYSSAMAGRAVRISATTRRIAASRLRPASTQTMIRSRLSGKDSKMSRWRWRTFQRSAKLGR
ncbi:hypothetical protein D3C85_1496790 [compost metagenome]